MNLALPFLITLFTSCSNPPRIATAHNNHSADSAEESMLGLTCISRHRAVLALQCRVLPGLAIFNEFLLE